MSKALKRSTLFFFVLPQIPLAGMALPLYIHLPPFYAAHFGISLTAIGTIFMLARFWDVFTDPAFGLMAHKDRHSSSMDAHLGSDPDGLGRLDILPAASSR